MTAPALVQKLRNSCSILRDDGLSDGDYLEQLSFLLLLKMRTILPNTTHLTLKDNPLPFSAIEADFKA
jgi:hypothetical protein